MAGEDPPEGKSTHFFIASIIAIAVLLGRNADHIIRALGETSQMGARSSSSVDDVAEMMRARRAADDSDAVHEAIARQGSRPIEDAWSQLPGEEIERTELPRVRFEGDRRVHHPRLIAAFPSTADEYEAVFGRIPGGAGEQEIKRLNETISGLDGASAWPRPPPVMEFRDVLESHQGADAIVIVTHAEDRGRMVVLSNGQRLTLKELHSTCAEVRKSCIVMSCYSRDLKLESEITTKDAISIWKSAQRMRTPDMTVDEYTEQLRLVHSRNVIRQRIAISTLAVATSTAGGMTLITSRRNAGSR